LFPFAIVISPFVFGYGFETKKAQPIKIDRLGCVAAEWTPPAYFLKADAFLSPPFVVDNVA
jgi:hypothetical protein